MLKPAAGPPSGTDGRYRGTVRLVRAGVSSCPRSGPRVLEISGGQITLSYNAAAKVRQPLTASVDGDGSITASDGVGTMEGRLADGRLDLTIASAICEHRWSLTRVP